jgi:ribonuclease P protein component
MSKFSEQSGPHREQEGLTAGSGGLSVRGTGGPGSPAGGKRPPAAGKLGFPRAMRLLKRVEYEAVYGAGQRRSSSQFSVFFRAQTGTSQKWPSKEIPGEEPPRRGLSTAGIEALGTPEIPGASDQQGRRATSRFGISVKKALGGAVVRNRIRRRIREILRRNRTEIPTGWDIVIHPRSSVARAEFASLEAELVRLLRGIETSGPMTNRGTNPGAWPKGRA